MRFLALVVLVALVGCHSKPDNVEDFQTMPMTLPGGQIIRVEMMLSNFDLTRGMMFRTSLAPDRGMLFIYQTSDRHQHWMYQTLIPLDMIWMDVNRTIVEIVENAQPCQTQASKCPQYGGTQFSNYVLEIGGGLARKYGLRVGQTLQW